MLQSAIVFAATQIWIDNSCRLNNILGHSEAVLLEADLSEADLSEVDLRFPYVFRLCSRL